MSKYIFLYQTKCLINGKTYVGVHRTNNLNDGYIGCGIRNQGDALNPRLLFQKAVKKHGYDNFVRYIYSFYDTYEEALEEEKWIVNENWVKSHDNYNSAIGGRGSTTKYMSEERKEKLKKRISERVKEWFEKGGKEKMKDIVPNIKRVKKFGEDNVLYGKPSKLRRPIVQYDKNMNFIKRFDYITQAANETGAQISSISCCCNGVAKTAGGFVFRYETYSEKELETLNKNLIRKKRVSKRKGTKLSEETKKKISDSRKLYYQKKKLLK